LYKQQPERDRKIEVRKDEGKIMKDRKDIYWVESGEKGISVLQGFKAAPARPSDKNSIKAKTDDKRLLRSSSKQK
jgi:hypothetical protein